MANERFLVKGGARLSGQVRVSGAKNSVLKLMGAALLAEGTTVLTNCPAIDDVPLMQKVLEGLGCTVEREGDVVRTTPPSPRADFDAVRQFRASVCVLTADRAVPEGHRRTARRRRDGSRLTCTSRAGEAGARTYINHGCVVAEADKLTGGHIS